MSSRSAFSGTERSLARWIMAAWPSSTRRWPALDVSAMILTIAFELADHHRGHAVAGLADLLESALDEAFVAGLGRDDPDEPVTVAVHTGRMPPDGDLAEAVAEPVDTGQCGEGVVDRR